MNLDNARVIWSEGMFLRPHHFQQQERYLESFIDAKLAPMGRTAHGILELVIDHALLLKGKVSIAHARGIFDDGTPFDLASATADLQPFLVPEGTRDAVLYLHVEMRRAGTKMISLEHADRRIRYEGTNAKVHDHVLGFDLEADLKVGMLALTLGLKSSCDGARSSLPVAHIVERKADGGVLLDDRFVPPLLDVGAHSLVRSWVDELYGLLTQRGAALAARIGAPGADSLAEFEDFILLQTCNRYEPLLAHFRQVSPLHPMALYGELLKLAGECSTSGRKDRRPPVFPPYRHDALTDTFEPVIKEIRLAMADVIMPGTVPIPLQDLGNGWYGATIPDLNLIRTSVFVLAAAAQMPKEVFRANLPTQIKIGPVDRIHDFVNSLTPGVKIEPVEAPRRIPFLTGFTYFQLDERSDHWIPIEASRRMALFVPGNHPGLQLRMWAMRK